MAWLRRAPIFDRRERLRRLALIKAPARPASQGTFSMDRSVSECV